jgi:hypothetical protein
LGSTTSGFGTVTTLGAGAGLTVVFLTTAFFKDAAFLGAVFLLLF